MKDVMKDTYKMLFRDCDECYWIEFGVVFLGIVMIMTAIALCMKCCLKKGNDSYYEHVTDV